MRILPIGYRSLMRSLERYLANQVEQREDKAIAAHIAAVNASIGRPSKRRQERSEPMPYRHSIAAAFVALAAALAVLSWWCP